MVKMPMDFVAVCKLKHLPEPYTMYKLRTIPDDETRAPYYEVSDTFVPGIPKGQFKLLFALKSFPHYHDNRQYVLFFVTNMGLFVEEYVRSYYEEPVDFRNVMARYVHSFNHGDVIINHPGTRVLLPLYNVRFTEVINGKSYPNSFDFYDHPELAECEEHKLILESNEFPPVEVEFNKDLYLRLRLKLFYLHLRSDNYMKLSQFKFWRPSY